MKRLIFILVIGFGWASCSSDDKYEAEKGDLIGNWVLAETLISAGGPHYWVDVDHGNQLQFQEDGKFNSDRFKECSDGLFRINGNELLLQYTCDDFKPKNENDEGFDSYHIEYKSDHFILKPTSGPICIEGCSYKYRRE